MYAVVFKAFFEIGYRNTADYLPLKKIIDLSSDYAAS